MRPLRLVAALVCALPWLRVSPRMPAAMQRVIDEAFLPLCHHLAGRVLVFGGEGGQAMCVCSRCAGLYAGLFVGFLLDAPRWGERVYPRLFGLALAMTVVDVVTQDLGLHEPWHPVRLATGALLGWTAAAWMVRVTARSRRSPARLQHG